MQEAKNRRVQEGKKKRGDRGKHTLKCCSARICKGAAQRGCSAFKRMRIGDPLTKKGNKRQEGYVRSAVSEET